MKAIDQKLNINDLSSYAKNQIDDIGYVSLKDYFSQDHLSNFEQAVIDLYILQAKKIGDYREKAIEIDNSKMSNFEKFSAICEMMEENDKEALYQVQKYLTSSLGARSLFDQDFVNLCAGILGSDKNSVLVDGPALFVNRPNTQRLLYKWHSEAHYYPKRRKFLNIWLPLFDKKSKLNGTMSFKEKSHLRDFPFADYQGYNKDTQNKNNFFVQYEVPANLLKDYKEHYCDNNPGDLVVFSRSMVHTSNQNMSDKYSVAVVARVWDPSDDLTLSGTISATPYGGNIGRSNLIVDPLD